MNVAMNQAECFDLERSVRQTGYHLRAVESFALRAAAARNNGRARVIVIEGPPGTGKTALGRAVAKALDAHEEFVPCHHWLGDDELFHSVDIGRVASRDLSHSAEAYRPGALTRALLATLERDVVLIVDELDKAPERVDALLLEFLQAGRVIDPFGQVVMGNPSRLWVFVTSNGLRPLSEPLLRRGFRLTQQYLPEGVESRLLREATGAKPPVIKVVTGLARAVRRNGASSPSLEEMRFLLGDLAVAENSEEVAFAIQGWILKEPEDLAAIGGRGGLKSVAERIWRLL
jgi:MoxR-like ATPase